MDDGFYVLIPVKHTEESIPEDSPKKKKHKKLPHFKKSSWKHSLLSRMKKWRDSKNVEEFHFTKLENLVVCFGRSKSTVLGSSTRFSSNRLRSISKKYEEAYVLINCTDQMYMRMPIKSYLKLNKIKKIGIFFTLEGSYDGVETVDISHCDLVIDNINELCKFINYHRQGVEGVYQLQCECCGFMEYDYKFKMLVWKTDNAVDVYKGDMNDFMKEYGLHLF